MGSRAGGVFDFFGAGDTTYKGKVKNVESLVHIKDRMVYKDVKEAISRFYSAMGVPERNVKIADLSSSVVGIGSKGGVYFNKKYYNMSHKDFVAFHKKQEAIGHLTQTNKPAAHTTTHELAHALWSTGDTSPKAKAAGKEIKSAYNKWKNSRTKTKYGRYANSNVDEWWAETVTKAVHGKADGYTKFVKAIAKKYKL